MLRSKIQFVAQIAMRRVNGHAGQQPAQKPGNRTRLGTAIHRSMVNVGKQNYQPRGLYESPGAKNMEARGLSGASFRLSRRCSMKRAYVRYPRRLAFNSVAKVARA
jgi:hypothetical protein